MLKHKLVLFSLLLAITGCTTTVKLNAYNSEKFPVNLVAEIKDKNNFTQSEIDIGSIQPNDKIDREFEVDDDGGFVLSANIPNSASIFTERRSVRGRPDPDPEKVTISNQSGGLDETANLNILSDSFRKLGDDIVAEPLSVQDALNTVFGGIVVVTFDDKKKPLKVLQHITPEQLGMTVSSLDEFRYPDTEESKTTQITGKSAANIGASIGPYAAFDASFNSDKLYTLQWTLKGFGPIARRETEHYVIKLKNLDKGIREELSENLAKNSTAKLLYINRIFVIKNATLKITSHKKLEEKAGFNAANIVTGSGVFSQASENQEVKTYSDKLIGYTGDELNLTSILKDPSGNPMQNTTLKPNGEKHDLSPEDLQKLTQ